MPPRPASQPRGPLSLESLGVQGTAAAAPPLSVRHVRPHGKGWQVIRDGAARPLSVHAGKHDAISAALDLAARDGGAVLVHTQGQPALDADGF